MNNSSASFNSTPHIPPSQSDSHVRYYILKAVLLIVLLVTGLVCNILVIVIIIRNRHLRKSINCFILSMALSDLFVPFFSIPIYFQMIIMNPYGWLVGGVFGDILCKVVYFFSDLSPLISSFSLVFMTLDRFIAIVYPTKLNLRTPTFRKRLVVLSWLIPIIYCSKNFYSHKVLLYGDFLFCGEKWSHDFSHGKTYTQFMTFYTVCFVYIPFILLTVMYIIIIGTLYKQQTVLKNNISCRLQQKLRQKQRRRVITLALAIVLAFLICYGPMNYSLVMQSYVKHWVYDDTITSREMIFVSFALGYSNATINPLICMTFHKDMRICVTKMICRRLTCLRSNKTFNLKLSYVLDTLEMDKRNTVTTSTIKNFSDFGIEIISVGEEQQHNAQPARH